MSGEVAKRDLEQRLTDRIMETLREPGPGFSFVGRQVHLEVGGDDFYIDLLFFHVEQLRYYVFDGTGPGRHGIRWKGGGGTAPRLGNCGAVPLAGCLQRRTGNRGNAGALLGAGTETSLSEGRQLNESCLGVVANSFPDSDRAPSAGSFALAAGSAPPRLKVSCCSNAEIRSLGGATGHRSGHLSVRPATR
ncbi:PDDEXK nuclease domain-containing protein [Arthrobacter sulfonylureivorans]|uniref:PDDEXK nuclease domain-containing protein n=1 Tax=Arthrobacter sulfonylureivorans TaxID=2486855 RepID=UPI0030D0A955